MSPLSEMHATESSVHELPSATMKGTFSNLRVMGISALGFIISGLFIAYAENLASSGDATRHFTWFWIGFFAGTFPVVIFLVHRRVSDAQRVSLVVALAFWSLIPKWIRTGIQPTYSDEYQHARLLHNIASTGVPSLQPSVLLVGAHFPGLELASAGFASVTGISVQWSAVIIVGFAHAAILVGIFALAVEITRSVRAGAIAAIVYFLNPGFLYFDAQFAYETLALVFVVWTFVFMARAIGSASDERSERNRWINVAMAVISSAALIFTHHVTAIFCAIVLLSVALVLTLRRRRGGSVSDLAIRQAWVIAGFASLITAFRFYQLHGVFSKYLEPVYNIGQQFHQLLFFFGIGSSHAQRSLTGGSTIPKYEFLSTYLMIPILLGFYALAVWLLWLRRREVSPFVTVSVVLALVFFASLPLDTSSNLAETVHRSWAYSFVGLALVLAAGSTQLGRINEVGKGIFRRFTHGRWRTLLSFSLVASFVVVSFGGVSSGTDIYYRFGSPVVVGVDGASVGTQTDMVRDWMKTHAHRNDVVFGDRYVIYPMIGSTDVILAPKIELIWDFTFSPEISMRNLRTVYGAHVTYIVVDRRMGTQLPPLDGFWYYRGEPYTSSHTVVPAENVYRYRCFSWLSADFVTKDYTVYQVSRSSLHEYINQGHIGLRKGCMSAVPHA